STYQLAITVGILASYLTSLFEPVGTWRLMFGLAAVPGAVFLLGLAFLPESPRWLVLRGRIDDARASLRRLGTPRDIDATIEEMARSMRLDSRSGYRALLDPAIRPALVVAMGLFLLQQLSGINAVIYYALAIFDQAGFDSGQTQVLATIGL